MYKVSLFIAEGCIDIINVHRKFRKFQPLYTVDSQYNESGSIERTYKTVISILLAFN